MEVLLICGQICSDAPLLTSFNPEEGGNDILEGGEGDLGFWQKQLHYITGKTSEELREKIPLN